MNFRKYLKRKRTYWRNMAKSNCRLFDIPFKQFLTWDELPPVYHDLPYCHDILWRVTHYGLGAMLINPCVKETDFTHITKES